MYIKKKYKSTRNKTIEKTIGPVQPVCPAIIRHFVRPDGRKTGVACGLDQPREGRRHQDLNVIK